jgi:hypothetical protein
MPIDQFTRAYFAMNKVLEDASQKLSLSKRAAVVLLILADRPNGEIGTKDLVETFQKWYVSTENTAAKDVSIAKGELFKDDLIMARHGIRNIELTENGRERVLKLVGMIEQALKTVVDGHQDLLLLKEALSTIKPKMPEKALSSVGVTKKHVDSSRNKAGLRHVSDAMRQDASRGRLHGTGWAGPETP